MAAKRSTQCLKHPRFASEACRSSLPVCSSQVYSDHPWRGRHRAVPDLNLLPDGCPKIVRKSEIPNKEPGVLADVRVVLLNPDFAFAFATLHNATINRRKLSAI